MELSSFFPKFMVVLEIALVLIATGCISEDDTSDPSTTTTSSSSSGGEGGSGTGSGVGSPLEVLLQGTGFGKVISDPPGLECESPQSACFANSKDLGVSGMKLKLSAVAHSGSKFVRWENACDGQTGTTCEVDVPKASMADGKTISVVAVFQVTDLCGQYPGKGKLVLKNQTGECVDVIAHVVGQVGTAPSYTVCSDDFELILNPGQYALDAQGVDSQVQYLDHAAVQVTACQDTIQVVASGQ